ncbi:hypothetical protein EV715DRAFT_268236 [Schizophyllum commune]
MFIGRLAAAVYIFYNQQFSSEHLGQCIVQPHPQNNIVRSTAAVFIRQRLGNLGDDYRVYGRQFPDIEFPATSTMASRYFDGGRVSSALQLGEVAVVAIRRLEFDVAVTRACSFSPRGALSLKLTTGLYRTLAKRSSIAFLFPYALHSTTLAFNIVQASKSPQGSPSLCTPLYETAMHSSLQEELALDITQKPKGWFLLEDDDRHIMRGKYKGREGKVIQVYRKKWVINRLLASITRPSLSLPAARFHYPPLV